jgi:serine/threonine protein kinase
MGTVYRAHDPARDHVVALKTLHRADPASLHRFKNEFRSLAGVAHTNLVALHELVSDGEVWYFTMELIDGVNLLEWVWSGGDCGGEPISTCGPLDISPESRVLSADQLARLRDGLKQLSAGVSALHSAGILHRDIKPSNVLVDRNGRVVLLDFGLALTMREAFPDESAGGMIIGTVDYMSPEQSGGELLLPSSDWYSVGVMLYEMLSGRLPFTGKTSKVVFKKQHGDPRPPKHWAPGIPDDLNDLCVALLSRDAGARPTAGEVMLRLAVTGSPAPPPATLSLATGHAPLIGRKRHLQMLRDAFDAIRHGVPASVLVHGISGQGKSSLVEQFLDEIRRYEDAVVLTGRCYERESVPYKALDSLVDALSDYLVQLPESDAALLMPRHVQALAKVFPVLRRVETICAAHQRITETPDRQELRRRAFSALRELLARIADHSPLVLYIDDLQWGDVDSAALLWELLRPPDAPVLLVLGCYRSDEKETSPFLRRLHELRQDAGAEMPELEIGPLSQGESVELALALLGKADIETRKKADEIARESGGNPFFVAELAKHAHMRLDRAFPASAHLKLDDVLWSRVMRCSTQACRLLHVVAVAGVPIQSLDAFKAAKVVADGPTVLVQLQSDHLIRSVGSGDEAELAPYHDRVRESVVSHLSPDALKDCHQRLAETLVANEDTDPEILASHFDGAGRPDEARRYYLSAAEQAAGTLAFEHAARLYRRALDLSPADAPNLLQLRKDLGYALANAGRGRDAAEAYLAAAQDADAAEALELRRRAAMQYVLSGHLDESIDELRNVLAAVGMQLPKTPLRALVSLLWQRLRLRLRGLKFTERSEKDVPAGALIRIDTCWSVGRALSVVDPIRGAEFQTRSLLLGLQAGEPYRIARSLAWEAAHTSTAGGREARRTSHLLEAADALSQQVSHPHALGMVALANGISAYLEGRFRLAQENCDRAEQTFRDGCTGVAWELDTAHTFALWSLTYMGEVAELSRRRPKLLKEARERGDLYALTNFSTYIMSFDRLAADQVDEGREELAEAMQLWTQRGFLVQHHNALLAETYMDLYCGNAVAAWERIAARWSQYGSSLLMRVQEVRIDITQSRGRCALAVAASADDPGLLLKSALADARRLERDKMPWSIALAKLIVAGATAISGDANRAAAQLKTAAHHLRDVDMQLFAAVASQRRGELIGGEEGRMLVSESIQWMQSQNVKDPDRFANMVLPRFDSR